MISVGRLRGCVRQHLGIRRRITGHGLQAVLQWLQADQRLRPTHHVVNSALQAARLLATTQRRALAGHLKGHQRRRFCTEGMYVVVAQDALLHKKMNNYLLSWPLVRER